MPGPEAVPRAPAAPRTGRPRRGPWRTPHGLDACWEPELASKTKGRRGHVELTKASWGLDRETAPEAYRDPMTGLLSSTGMGAAARAGDKLLSIDVEGLKATDGFSSRLADEVIRRTGALMKLLGDKELQAAHPHGDEYAAAHPDPQVLRTFAEQLRDFLADMELCYTNVELGVTFVQRGIGFPTESEKPMKQPSTPSSSTSSSAPSQESETGKANATSRGADSSSAPPPSGSSAKHGIEDTAPVSIKSSGVEVWTRACPRRRPRSGSTRSRARSSRSGSPGSRRTSSGGGSARSSSASEAKERGAR